MTNQKLPLHLENPNYKLYGSPGERIAAGLLDGIFMLPVTMGLLYFNSVHLYNYYYTTAIVQLIVMWYTIYLPVRYGATPGKRVMGLTILNINGAAITYREAILKYLPMLGIAVFSVAIQCWSISLADADVYDGLPFMKQANYLKSFYPFPLWVSVVIIYGYYGATIFLVFLNARKRSLSDLVAGTVVVHTKHLDQIADLPDTSTSAE